MLVGIIITQSSNFFTTSFSYWRINRSSALNISFVLAATIRSATLRSRYANESNVQEWQCWLVRSWHQWWRWRKCWCRWNHVFFSLASQSIIAAFFKRDEWKRANINGTVVYRRSDHLVGAVTVVVLRHLSLTITGGSIESCSSNHRTHRTQKTWW